MKIIIFIITCMLTTSLQATNFSSANNVCNFNEGAMVVELKGGVLRYIIGDYAMHKPPVHMNYSKGKLMLSNMDKMNVSKVWQFESNRSIFGGRINSPLTFDLTSKYGSYAPFNVYELCR